MEHVFPGHEWQRLEPADAGFSTLRLTEAEQWLHTFAGDQPSRLVIARHGYLVAEWTTVMDPTLKISMRSASKSFYSSLLGIAVADGRLPGLDAKVFDY